MKFKEIFVDFDETIVNSVLRVCEIYNEKFDSNVRWQDTKLWCMKDVCPLFEKGEINDIFSSDLFFKKLSFKEDMFEVLSELSKDYKITVVSIGTENNCQNKKKFIEDKLPFVSKSVLLPAEKGNIIMDKSSVDMSGGIFIDDAEDNLFSSNADVKVLYQNLPNTEWNSKWDGERIKYWSNFYKYFI